MSNKPFIVKLADFLLVFAPILLILNIVTCSSNNFGTGNKAVFYTVLGLLIADVVIWLLIVMFSKTHRADVEASLKSHEEEKLKKQIEEMKKENPDADLKPEHFTFVRKSQYEKLKAVLKSYYDWGKTTCPICGSKIEQDKESYELYKNYNVNQAVEGVYVSRPYMGNQVEQAYETVSKSGNFPAIRYSCPHCKWECFEGEYTSYEDQKGEYEVYSHYGNGTYTVREFHPGMLNIQGFKSYDDGISTHSGGTFVKSKAYYAKEIAKQKEEQTVQTDKKEE